MSESIQSQLNIKATLADAASRLRDAGVESPRLDARLLLRHATGMRDEEIFAQHNCVLPQGLMLYFNTLVGRRATREPVAYIVGEKEFWSLSFEVSPATLIPRPDSETLVAAALGCMPPSMVGPRVLDLGVGSGCLLISILHEVGAATGVGVDISVDAAEIARRNAGRAGVGSRARFIVGDWAQAISGQFDIIVTNPPYVSEDERTTMANDVVGFEPARALYAGIQGDDSYIALAPQLPALLAPGGTVVAEFGQGQASRVSKIFRAEGLAEIERRTDLAGIERCALYGHNGLKPNYG